MKIECEQGACDNRVLQRRAFKRTIVRPILRRGEAHWAVYMVEKGYKGDILEEYVGEAFTFEDFERRREESPPSSNWYFCELAHGVVLDASAAGSYARFINHHCEPNAELVPWSVKSYRRLAVSLLRDAEVGEEVTFSYDYEKGIYEQECWCNAPSCTGKICRLPGRVRDRVKEEKEESVSSEASKDTRGLQVPSPPAPPSKRRREGGALGKEGGRAPGDEVTVKMEREEPSDAEVLAAMRYITDHLEAIPDVDESGQQIHGRLVWMSLRKLLGMLPNDTAQRHILETAHADNVRAFLMQRGPPFVLPTDIVFDRPTKSLLFSAESAAHPIHPRPRQSQSAPVTIDLTDSPPVSPRLDEGATTGGVRAEGSVARADANSDGGGQGVGRC
mmetsp:Transcript_18272/g.36952  ORF Transcript_18272/g.36952 Transcript_18272/m.36952 type:complete len:389 (-) Transcript_18272:4530-5696(-)